MYLLDAFPILVVDDACHDDTAAGRATQSLIDHLRADGTRVTTATDLDDAREIITSTANLSAVLIDWDVHHPPSDSNGEGGVAVRVAGRAETLVKLVRERNQTIPIFLLADRSSAEEVPTELLQVCSGYVWKLEDTPEFIARRVEEARREYLQILLPPFFQALAEFTEEARYSWHTPGHSGGTAFLKTPVGAAFHQFFGENTLRSDLSVSVGDLGSLLEHSGPVGAAEAEAASTFGADRTMFVTNGTSTANKIVFHACVRPHDVVLVDRNCHKSIMHAIVMTHAIPVYLHPTRNAYGIIGPIPQSELSKSAVAARVRTNPLVPEGVTEPALAVVTNSTYDGLCYDAQGVLDALSQTTRRVLFDEAWYGYAHFHSLYAGRHAMGVQRKPGQAATFATQSTHKLLAAFSQASMIHLQDSDGVIPRAALEEAFMMHTSTSPQYGIIASLDVASRMMRGTEGSALIDDAVQEAIAFRRELAELERQCSEDDWCFRAWQPDDAPLDPDEDHTDSDRWTLREHQGWHGFARTGEGHAMLDPIKVTILTPGVKPEGGLAGHGIPAALISHFLSERGIVVEKTGAYSFLVLFSLGITKGKSGTLLAELLEFKRLYDSDAPLHDALPRLVAAHPHRYAAMTLRELGAELHGAMRAADMTSLQEAMYAELPEPAASPATAFQHLVVGGTAMVPIDELPGRVSAAMVVPYPPGIPVVMPGERFGAGDSGIVRYLTASQDLDAHFPGFETEIHGVQIQPDGSYRVPCLGTWLQQPPLPGL